eukprot:2260913-Rhodomonas_salina.1
MRVQLAHAISSRESVASVLIPGTRPRKSCTPKRPLVVDRQLDASPVRRIPREETCFDPAFAPGQPEPTLKSMPECTAYGYLPPSGPGT